MGAYEPPKAHQTITRPSAAPNRPSISEPADISPAFTEKNVAVFFCTDTNNIPYALVTAASVKAHASADYNYDIVIAHTGEIKNSLLAASTELMAENFSVRFLDISENVGRIDDKLFISRHLTKGCYYRLLIPEICTGYEKILYLDTDMVTLADVGALYNDVDLKGYLLAAVKDYFMQAVCSLDLPQSAADRRYFEEILRVPLDEYFQSGLLLMNIRQMREEKSSENFFNILDKLNDPNFHDQDVLNRTCRGRVVFLDAAWNIRHNIPMRGSLNPLDTMTSETRKLFDDAYGNPKVLHYPGSGKPWKNVDLPKACLWWRYAAQTPLLADFIKNVRSPVMPFRPFQRKWLHTWWYQFLHTLFPTLTDAVLIAFSGAFDASYYFNAYPALLKKFRNPILGYVRKGAREGRNPNAYFDTTKYSEEHPELEKMKINPLVHFLFK
jgi:lipopolysaccharide biosynthesis glycosyltransferase